MIQDWKELEFPDDLAKTQVVEQVLLLIDQVLKDKLEISLEQIKEALSESVKNKAEELTHQFINIAPHGQYDKLLEDNDSMADFIRNEASKPENWRLSYIQPDYDNPQLLQFMFSCDAVDDGDDFRGYVYVSKSGKIRHAFACGE